MLSSNAAELARKIATIRQRMDKAKDEIVTAARPIVMVLEYASEQEEIGKLMADDGAIQSFIELIRVRLRTVKIIK